MFRLTHTSILLSLFLTSLTGYSQVPGESENLLPVYYKAPTKVDRKVIKCDVVAYGGTPSGITATIQAAGKGKKAVLISSYNYVGGMTSGGLTATDVGNKDSISGMAMNFYKKAGTISNFTPTKAEAIYRQMLKEAGVEVLYNCFLESIEMKDGKIVSITMETGETVKASIFVDSTYEGDLLAAANVSYYVGREPRSAYNETLAGQWQTVSWKNVYQFCRLPISPYNEPGNPKSGLLPEISSEPAGKPGEGDYRVQAYNFRMYLSNKAGKIPFPKPPEYNRERFALLERFLNFNPKVKWTLNYTTKPMTDGPVQMRNGDSNNAGSFSSDYVGGSHYWPDGTFEPVNISKLPEPRKGLQIPFRKLYEMREKIFQDHINYQLGMIYFLANDPAVPKALQKRVNKFGLEPKEFKDTGHWPHHLYIREGRRMVSDYVMTQADCQSKRVAKDSVGLASYPMDSHFCQRVPIIEKGKMTVRNEGGFGHHCPKPYPVSYRSIVPKKSECTNLFVPGCLSSSHVAYGSIRMEPVFMILGQSAGMAAVMAIDENIAVQDVDYNKLKKQLLEAGQILYYKK